MSTVHAMSTVSTVSTVSTGSTVSTVIARCYLHLRWYFFGFCVLSFSCFSVSRVFCLICFIHTSKTFSVLSFPYFSVHICCLFSQTSLSIFRLIEPDNLSSFEWNQNNNALRNILNSFFNNRKTEKYKKSPCHIYKRSSNRLLGIVDPSPTHSPISEKKE